MEIRRTYIGYVLNNYISNMKKNESENCEWCKMIILKCRNVGFSPLANHGWALGKCTCENKGEYIKNYEKKLDKKD